MMLDMQRFISGFRTVKFEKGFFSSKNEDLHYKTEKFQVTCG
jgi:hypothetical protein